MKLPICKELTPFAIATVFAVVLACSPLFAYLGEFQIGDEPVNPRLSSMGSAGTADEGSGFCFYNPASPAFAPAPFLTAEFGRLPGDLSKSLIAAAWMSPKWFAGASMRVHSTDFGVTTEQTPVPEGVPLSSNQILQANLTGGFTFGSGRFAAGQSLAFFQQRIGDKVYRSWTWSPGIVYRLVPGRVTLGASMLNYVRLDTVRTPWYTTPRGWYEGAWGLPRYVRAGGSWSDTIEQASLPFTIAGDVVYSDVYDRVMVPLGTEVWLTPYLAARTGVTINHPSEKIHFGAGVRWTNVIFDFDYGLSSPVARADLETKWLVGLTYSLKSTVRPAPSASVTNVPRPKENTVPAQPPKTYAPPKRILLTPKKQDSTTTAPQPNDTAPKMPSDTTAAAVPQPAPVVEAPDSTASGNPRPLPVPGTAALPDSSAGNRVPSPVDSVQKPDSLGK